MVHNIQLNEKPHTKKSNLYSFVGSVHGLDAVCNAMQGPVRTEHVDCVEEVK